MKTTQRAESRTRAAELSDDSRDPIELLAEEFTGRIRRGESPEIDEYVLLHPEFAGSIRDLFPALEIMEQSRARRKRTPSADASQLDRLGDYRLIREIGRGGMGVVYLATQESLDRKVALKVLFRQSLGDENRRDRFEREARAAGLLHHTNIVPVFGFGEHEGIPFYAMQYIDGVSLRKFLDETRRLVAKGEKTLGNEHWRFTARLGAQTAEALHHAHLHGILHRDIKPSNLLLDRSGSIWVADFGLAKLEDQRDLTDTGDIVGTVRYLAPECLERGGDARSDVYSLGLTLYECLLLESAFGAASPRALLRMAAEGKIPRLRRLNKRIPRDLEIIVLKATARDPRDRYATAEELASDLHRWLDDRPVRARRAGPIERLSRWCGHNRALAGSSAAAILSLALAAVVGWRGYVIAAAALERESIKRAEAEANLQLCLRSFEDIFQQATSMNEMPEPIRRFSDIRIRRVGRRILSLGPLSKEDERFRRQRRPVSVILESVLGFYDQFAALNSTSPDLRKEAAKAFRRVGILHYRSGRTDLARAALNRSIRMLEDLIHLRPEPGETSAVRESYYAELAETLLASVEHSQDPEAERFEFSETGLGRLRSAARIMESLLDRSPDNPQYSERLARTSAVLGSHLAQNGDHSSAVIRHERAERIYESLRRKSPLDPILMLNQQINSHAYAIELFRTGAAARALEELENRGREVEAIRSFGKVPDSTRFLLTLIDESLAEALAAVGRTERSEELKARVENERREFLLNIPLTTSKREAGEP